jgi:hypothetical protein
LLLPPTIAFAKAVQILKACSSKWINDTHAGGKDFAWQIQSLSRLAQAEHSLAVTTITAMLVPSRITSDQLAVSENATSAPEIQVPQGRTSLAQRGSAG